MSKQESVLDKPLGTAKNTIPLSTFSYLFSEYVQYAQAQANDSNELELNLHKAGYPIGLKLQELLSFRDAKGLMKKKDRDVISLLQYISTTVWKQLFGTTADSLEKSKDKQDEYYIFEKNPLTNKYISPSREFGSVNCAAFIAGILSGILHATGINCDVTVVNSTQSHTVYVIKIFQESS